MPGQANLKRLQSEPCLSFWVSGDLTHHPLHCPVCGSPSNIRSLPSTSHLWFHWILQKPHKAIPIIMPISQMGNQADKVKLPCQGGRAAKCRFRLKTVSSASQCTLCWPHWPHSEVCDWLSQNSHHPMCFPPLSFLTPGIVTGGQG
jgi:hypothetical protein